MIHALNCLSINFHFSPQRMQPDAFDFLEKVCNKILIAFMGDALFSSKNEGEKISILSKGKFSFK